MRFVVAVILAVVVSPPALGQQRREAKLPAAGQPARRPPENARVLVAAAAKYLSDVQWRGNSVLTADFSCRGYREQAILGIDASDIVIAVFLDGTSVRPRVLRYSAKVRDRSSAQLKLEDQDYDPSTEIGSDLPGFKRSRMCKGLNLSDGEIDSAHIYWNHLMQRFEDWVR
jgi:hypothetical protein